MKEKIGSKFFKIENRTVAINFISMFVLNGLSFLTAPIFTRSLGPEQYGEVGLFTTWVSVFSCVFGLSLHSAIGPGSYHFKDRYLEFRSNVLILGLLTCSVLAVLFLIFLNPLSQILHFSRFMVILMVVNSIGHFMINSVQSIYIYEKKPLNNFIISVSISLVSIVTSLVLVNMARPESRYIGRIEGMVIPHFVIAIVVFLFLFLKKTVVLKREFCVYALSFALPSIIHLLSGLVLSFSDRLMMKYMGISGVEIGIYTVYYSFCTVLTTILHALGNSWNPFYFDCLDKNDWSHTNKKCRNYIELFSVLACGFILLSREVGALYSGKEYTSGLAIIPILVCSTYFIFMYQFFVNFELFNKKARIVAIGTTGTAVLNFVLNLIFIPKYGMYGASGATAASYFILFVVHYLIASHFLETPCKMELKLFIPGLVCVAIASAMFYLLADFWYIRWFIGLCLGVYELRSLYVRGTFF